MKATQQIKKSGFSTTDVAFQDFVKTLRGSLKLWDYFVNWDKVFRNTRDIEVHLNIWNYLLGKPNFDSEFLSLLEKHPDIVKALPSLVVRDGSGSQTFSIVQNIKNLQELPSEFDFTKPASTLELRKSALVFVKESGLQKLFFKDGVKNLVDYTLGVEAGVDSNARKNRSGTAMEKVVEEYLEIFSKKNKLEFISQATPTKISNKWGFDVPLDKASRIFDFAISDGKKLVLMEVNFYGSSGSKLKATAGEYIGLGQLLDDAGYTFVWITDGAGWHTTLKPLKAAYDKLDFIWNLDWLGRDYLSDLF